MSSTGARFRQVVGSVRFRITGLAVLAVLLVLVAASVALVMLQRRVLTSDLEEALVRRADELEASIGAGALPDTLTPPGDEDGVIQVVDADGRVLAATANVLGAPAIAREPAEREAHTTSSELPHDDAEFLIVSRRIETDGGPAVVHVAGSLDDAAESGRVLGWLLLATIPVVVALLGAVVWWLVGRTLRPVEAIRNQVAGMGGPRLDRRVTVPPGDDEIARLARTMNDMLERVDAAVEQQQRFVADASHELRSPLTRLRTELEVDLAHPELSDAEATHHRLLEETIELQRLVDDLLVLARQDAVGTRDQRREAVDLDDLVLRTARRLRADGRCTIETNQVKPARTHGDPRELARAIANLADNAARHATSTIRFSLGAKDGRAVLCVADDGPGIPVDQRELVFERFARLDGARPRATGGAGLGLAIARDIVELHGGTITIDGDGGPGTRFVVTLPLDDDESTI